MTILFWAIWLALSVFIIGVFVWTSQALFQQKKVWKDFAVRRGLKYAPNRFLSSATVKGLIDGYEFGLTSEQRDSGDMRGRKFMTVIQFGLPMRMRTAAVLGSGEFTGFVRALQARDDLVLPFDGVPEGAVLGRTDDRERLDGYFTPERIKVLEALIKQKNVNVLFLFDDRYAFVRLETIDPMMGAGQLDKLVDKMIPMMNVLKYTPPAA